MKKEFNFSIKAVIIIIIVTAITSSITSGLILYNNSKILIGTSDLKKDTALQEFLKVYYGLDDDYYKDIDKTEMVDAAISAMLNYLGEDYSTYMNQDETEDLANKLSGKYNGIGISITNGNEIVKVYDDTPAKNAGLEEHDLIESINGTATEGLTQAEVANLIDKQNENTIVILRNNEELTFKVKAESINNPLPSTTYEENGKTIGYISISSFTNTVETEFKKALEELETKNISGLIIDLRNDGGGYLKGASSIASLFLEKGKTIYSLEGKDKTDTYKDETDEKRDYKVGVLINAGSASASEVLASALKDSYGAILIGEVSYGKGRVQQTKSLEDGSMVKYTTAKWLRPNGDCIDGLGLQPDYEVTLEKGEDGLYHDTQLEKAKDLLFE